VRPQSRPNLAFDPEDHKQEVVEFNSIILETDGSNPLSSSFKIKPIKVSSPLDTSSQAIISAAS
jgi:hypothetical protein